jgi:hypothetical protein
MYACMHMCVYAFSPYLCVSMYVGMHVHVYMCMLQYACMHFLHLLYRHIFRHEHMYASILHVHMHLSMYAFVYFSFMHARMHLHDA